MLPAARSTAGVCILREGHAPGDAHEETRRVFSEAELVRLTLAITQINAWNRIAIAFRAEPGQYQPRAAAD